jgi:hypothetical protein
MGVTNQESKAEGDKNKDRTRAMKKYKLSKQEVAQILEDFLEGRGSRWAWDDYTLGMSFEDEYLEDIRLRCVGLSKEFPPLNPNEYCNEQGREVLRGYVAQLRTSSQP